MKRNLVIDFDGTLVNPFPRDYRLYTDVLSLFGVDPLVPEVYWALRRESTPIGKILRMTWDDPQKDSFIAVRTEICEFEGYLKFNKLFPGITTTLYTLCNWYGCGLYLVSSRLKPTSLFNEITQLGLSPYFDDVLVAPGDKTATIESIGDVIGVVGDTEHDIRPAQKLGIPSIALTTGIRSRKLLSSYKPDMIVETFTHVPQILRSKF